MANVYGGASSSDCEPADRHLTRRLDWRIRRPGGSGCRAVPPVLRASVVRAFGLGAEVHVAAERVRRYCLGKPGRGNSGRGRLLRRLGPVQRQGDPGGAALHLRGFHPLRRGVGPQTWDATSGRFSGSRTTYALLVVVNLPPWQWVRLDLRGTLNDVEAMKGWRRAEFVGRRQRRGLFEGKTYRKTIATR